MRRFTTELGAVVTVTPSPDHLGDGQGSMLLITVDDRRAELYLAPIDRRELLEALWEEEDRT